MLKRTPGSDDVISQERWEDMWEDHHVSGPGILIGDEMGLGA